MTDCAIEPPSVFAAEPAVADAPSVKAWLAVLSVSLGAFASVTTEFLPVGLLPSIAKDLRVSDGIAGLMITVPGIAAAIAAPCVTVFSGRMNRRRLLWILTLLLVLSNTLSALAPTFAIMLVGRLLLGVSLGGFWSIAASMAGRLVSERHAGRALAVILGGISIGTIVGVPAGVLISNFVGWRGTFGLVAILAAIVFVKQFFVLPSLPTTKAVRVGDLGRVFQHRAARVGFLIAFSVVNGQFAAYTYVTPFLQQVPKVSESVLGTILLGYGLAGLTGNILAGFTAPANLRATYAALIAVMGTSALLLPILGHSTAGAATVLLIWGVGFGALPMCVQTWIFKSAPEAPEGATSLLVCVFNICIALGAAWGGRLVDAFHTPSVMYVGGGVMLLGLLTLLLGGPAPKGEAPADVLAH